MNVELTESYKKEIQKSIETIFMLSDLSETTIRALLMDTATTNEVPMDLMFRTQKLSEKFIELYYQESNSYTKEIIYKFQNLNESFIERHIDDFKKDINIRKAICQNISLSEKFIDKYIDFICWEELSENHNFVPTLSFVKKYFTNFLENNCLVTILINRRMPSNDVNLFLAELDPEYISSIDWRKISWGVDLTEDNILKYLDYLDFSSFRLSKRKYENETLKCYNMLINGEC